MFNKKNDPLVESVKAVMKENEFRRQAEAALNEELGISSKKALPHEYHEAYDRALQNVISEANIKHPNQLDEKLTPEAKQNIRNASLGNRRLLRAAMKIALKDKRNIMNMKKDKQLDEKVEYSDKQNQLARLGNAAGEGGNPNEIDKHDLKAAREGHADKVGLEEKLTKKMSAGKIISDFVHSRNPKFKGKSKKERQKMALGAYYGMHPEESKSEKVDEQVKETPNFGLSGSVHSRIVQDAPKEKKVSVMPGGITATPPSKREAEMGKMKSGSSVNEESVIDEIRRNLEENLMAIHESGDDELFENYVNSLTEEELDILGLSEAGLTQNGETPYQRAVRLAAAAAAREVDPGPKNQTTSKALGGPGGAKARKQAREAEANVEQIGIAAGDAGQESGFEAYLPTYVSLWNAEQDREDRLNRDYKNLVATTRANAGRMASAFGPGTKTAPESPAPPRAAAPAPEPANRPPIIPPGSEAGSEGRAGEAEARINQNYKDQVAATIANAGRLASAFGPGTKTAPEAPAATPAAASAQSKPAAPRPAPRPAASSDSGPNIHMQAFGATAVSGDSARGPQVYRESKQIKESLESFLKNRFLKG